MKTAASSTSGRNSSVDSAISQYDVLLVEHENELALIPHNHVGNNRLGIFVKMNLQEFLQAKDTERQFQVIRTLMDIVQRQCIDVACQRAGKFLNCGDSFSPEKLIDTNAWSEPSTDAIVQFIRTLLGQEQEKQAKIAVEMDDADADKKRRRRSSLLRRSLSSGNMLEDQKKRIANRKSILMHLHQFDVSEGESSDEEADQKSKPSIKEGQKIEEKKEALPEAQEQVITQSSAATPLTDAAKPKKPTRRLERRSSFGSSATKSSTNIVHTANALDVLLERVGDDYQLQRNHTGNNRLAVMLDLRKDKYDELKDNKIELHRLCLDLIHTVDQHYKGRFLLEQQDGKFILLSNEQAVFATMSIFESNSATAMANAIVNNNLSMSSSVTVQSDDGSFASLPSHLQVTTDVHKAALASLQRRKKRQDTNTKISRMVNRSQLMAGHRAASVGTLDMADRPPPHVQVQRRASVGSLPDRRPTLSSFSQDIIRDMLLQLDESNQQQIEPLTNEFDDLF